MVGHCWLSLRFHRWAVIAAVPLALQLECEHCGHRMWMEY